MAACLAPDGAIDMSWFTGSARDFVRQTQLRSGGEVWGRHRLSPPVVRVQRVVVGAERHGAPTRLRADARRNRDRVLAAARELFASDGLSVSLDEIARRAGVGPGTVHRHFPTKEALIAAVAIGRLEQVVAQARSLANADDPGEVFRSQLSRMLAYGDDSAPLKGALAGTGLDIRTAAPEIAADLRDAVGLLLTRAQDAGAIRADLTIDDLLALLAGAYHAIQYAGVKAKSRQAQRLTAVLLDGLEPTPSHRV